MMRPIPAVSSKLKGDYTAYGGLWTFTAEERERDAVPIGD